MLIPIDAWAASYSDPPPSRYMLRKWARDGELHPAPVWVGKRLMIERTARRLTNARPTLVERLRAAT